MPLYEYACPQCGTFEKMQKFSDPILQQCPTCGHGVTKLLSAPAIQFKGSGWYVTDYAARSKGGETKRDGDSQAAASKGQDASAASGATDKKDAGPKAETSSSPPKPAAK